MAAIKPNFASFHKIVLGVLACGDFFFVFTGFLFVLGDPFLADEEGFLGDDVDGDESVLDFLVMEYYKP
jgi:hypothetical protein